MKLLFLVARKMFILILPTESSARQFIKHLVNKQSPRNGYGMGRKPYQPSYKRSHFSSLSWYRKTRMR
jgi:hypothetical protein